MFPMEFDHSMLDSLPLPQREDVTRVIHVLKAIIVRRIVPYFRTNRGTDPIAVRRVVDHLRIERLEDAMSEIRAVTLAVFKNHEWTLLVHERVFDYLAFVIPTNPESRLGAESAEEGKMLAFAEFMLRHQLEHMFYPQAGEGEVVESDAHFAMERREHDPTFYKALRNALSDPMNGLRGSDYLELFSLHETGAPTAAMTNKIVNTFVLTLADIPEEILRDVFPSLSLELKIKALGVQYRRSRDTSFSLLRRTRYLQELLRFFLSLIDSDEKEAIKVFDTFKERWGLVYLFQELGLPETILEERDTQGVFDRFKDRVRKLAGGADGLFGVSKAAREPTRVPIEPAHAQPKSLRERIEDARKDPGIPRQVTEVIDKNKLNAVGTSGSKYVELIETLLSINWGKIQKIEVTPEDFEQGLDQSHYGLERPKQIITDFFANLIWRYQQFNPDKEEDVAAWKRNGSAFLFVGPPGVGKTSLAISIAQNLQIPYHKLSLGGMRDESDLRGHGFTYEGSKPGAIVQGIIKMGVMNGMFIMDEADKTDKVAISTLLEVLDPEQNHLFHDKYTQTTVDIDLSNFHFVLTANTLETVPPPVVNRCEVVMLDRYSIEEKVAIAKRHLIDRVSRQYRIGRDIVFLNPSEETDLLRLLIKTYTHEAGVRELERIIRTLFLRVFRKEVLSGSAHRVMITRDTIRRYLDPPRRPRTINKEDRVGEMMALGVNIEHGVGSVIPIQATLMRGAGDGGQSRGFLSMIHATGNIERVMDESRKVATTAILHCVEELGIETDPAEAQIHLHFMGGSTPKDGPSAGGAIALALASMLSGKKIRRDVAMTGEIDTQGRITSIGGLEVKLETAYDAGCKTVIIPTENLFGEDGIERLPEALRNELQILTHEEWRKEHEPFDYNKHVLQIVAVDHVLQAADVAFVEPQDIRAIVDSLAPNAAETAVALAEPQELAYRSLCLIYAKEPQEISPCDEDDGFWDDRPCAFLAPKQAMPEFEAALPNLASAGRFIPFDPAGPVGPVLDEIALAQRRTEVGELRFNLIAPFFFLRRDRGSLQVFSASDSSREITLFANNYTSQRFKVKPCKAVLNRVYWHLSQMKAEQLEACPFLGRQEGVYVLNCSFIPEKYRLDAVRAAELLNEALVRWTELVVGANPGHGHGPIVDIPVGKPTGGD